ncbi:hypothetical protein Tco_0609577 [Tanacetum coccineum]
MLIEFRIELTLCVDTIEFSETRKVGQIGCVTSRKRNTQTKDADDAFEAYSNLCDKTVSEGVQYLALRPSVSNIIIKAPVNPEERMMSATGINFPRTVGIMKIIITLGSVFHATYKDSVGRSSDFKLKKKKLLIQAKVGGKGGKKNPAGWNQLSYGESKLEGTHEPGNASPNKNQSRCHVSRMHPIRQRHFGKQASNNIQLKEENVWKRRESGLSGREGEQGLRNRNLRN